MIEQFNNNEEAQSKENFLVLNNKSLISKDVNSEIHTNRKAILNNIEEIK